MAIYLAGGPMNKDINKALDINFDVQAKFDEKSALTEAVKIMENKPVSDTGHFGKRVALKILTQASTFLQQTSKALQNFSSPFDFKVTITVYPTTSSIPQFPPVPEETETKLYIQASNWLVCLEGFKGRRSVGNKVINLPKQFPQIDELKDINTAIETVEDNLVATKNFGKNLAVKVLKQAVEFKQQPSKKLTDFAATFDFIASFHLKPQQFHIVPTPDNDVESHLCIPIRGWDVCLEESGKE